LEKPSMMCCRDKGLGKHGTKSYKYMNNNNLFMYPYKIVCSTKEQKEKHKDEIYGYANDLSEITKIIYKYADEYICENKNKIFREMEENDEISINTFYKMFDTLPIVKYFDISPRTWNEYEIDESELYKYFLSYFNPLPEKPRIAGLFR
jgi:hypothetical protein